MIAKRRLRKMWLLVGLVVAAIAYSMLLFFWHTLTGVSKTDGIIGIVLGLYICSHPAANFLDMILFSRNTWQQGWTRRSILLWITFNSLVLLIGWGVIFTGTTLFTTFLPG
jgi:hypothetical protein